MRPGPRVRGTSGPQPGPGWSLDRSGQVAILRCAALDALGGIGHGFSTRLAAGGGDHDVGDASQAFAAARSRVARAAGLALHEVAVARQVHGATVIRTTEARDRAPAAEADALIAVLPDDPVRLVPSVRTADCLPLLLADREGGAIAAVHAGWRGTAAGIVGAVVGRLRALGLPPERLVAVLGPAIAGCCYEVGEGVVRQVAEASGCAGPGAVARPYDDRFLLDLAAANRLQLERAGLDPESIHDCGLCTACRPDLLFSYRRSGGGHGRQLALIGWSGADAGARP